VCRSGLCSALSSQTGVMAVGSSGVGSGLTSVARALVDAAQPISVWPVDGRYWAEPMKKVNQPGGPYDETSVAVPPRWSRW
jgi:hypothetical protein